MEQLEESTNALVSRSLRGSELYRPADPVALVVEFRCIDHRPIVRMEFDGPRGCSTGAGAFAHIACKRRIHLDRDDRFFLLVLPFELAAVFDVE